MTDQDQALIDDYLDDRLGDDDLARFDQRLQTDPAFARAFALHVRLHQDLRDAFHAAPEIHDHVTDAVRRERGTVIQGPWRTVASVAAVAGVAALIAITAGVWSQWSPGSYGAMELAPPSGGGDVADGGVRAEDTDVARDAAPPTTSEPGAMAIGPALESGLGEPMPARPHDIDGDGTVDIRDAFQLARRLRDNDALDPRWDLSGDGRVDQTDVDAIARLAVRVTTGADDQERLQ